MYKRIFLSAVITAVYVTLSFAKVSINELSTCNYSSFMNRDNYNFSNYIEFTTDEDSVNLNGYTITHYGKQAVKGKLVVRWRWVVNKDWVITPNTVLWLDETKKNGHADFKLDADGGAIVLSEEGTVIDSLHYEKMGTNLAYGRTDKGCGYMSPTPGSPNSRAYADINTCRCASPTLSHKGGIMSEPFQLSIEGEGEIYYTTNGSDPTPETGTRYTEPIYIDRCSNIKAKSFIDSLIPSKTVTATYLINDKVHDSIGFSIPIVSITVDSSYFYSDSLGICVVGKNGVAGEKSCTRAKANYNQEWKRPVNFEYIVDGQSVVCQELEAKVEGGCSRTEKIKSLALKASNKTGEDSINYHFFQSKPDILHSTLHLRNGGTAYSKVRIRDGLMQTLAIGMNIDYQAFQPVAYYINGVYQGLMDLNERTNADYIEANYGIDEEDIDLITLSDQLGIRASEGDIDAYDDMVSALKNAGKADSVTLYERACGRMDMDEYVDYQIFQQFIVNTDWPGNNTKIWRERENGKFRWILFNTDFGFGLPGYEYLGGANKNMIEWCAGKGTLQWANRYAWMITIFRSLYQNRFFKKKFTTKFLIHLSSTLSPQRIEAVFDSISTLVDKEYQISFNGTTGKKATASMRSFAMNRHKYIYGHLQNYVGGGDTVSLQLASERKDAKLYFNGELITSYNGKYFSNYELELNVIPPQGYELDKWVITCDTIGEVASDTLEPRNKLPGYLVTKLRSGGKITATFKPADEPKPEGMPTLVINEICTSSSALSKNPGPNGKFSDWIEIYNYGEESYDLANYTLSIIGTDTKTLKQSTIPVGYEHTIIRPKEHKVLWANGDSTISPSSLNFAINKDSLYTICLLRNDTDYIDCVELVALQTNESYAREVDSSANWVIYGIDPLELNPTPGKKNGEKDTTGVNNTLADLMSLSLYPNPANQQIHIQASEPMEQVIFYDMTGNQRLRLRPKERQLSLEITTWPRGLYLIEIITDNKSGLLKFLKK
ncbi:MAG: CotH kinase family protein [Paludibacteraceae bacterium]|nr:CotH kinase family protein [Paludibacteraceae bacterium]